jgi:hypothetical protein
MHAMSDLATALLAFLAFAAVAFCAFGVILLAISISAALGARADRETPSLRREVTPARRSTSADRTFQPPA